MNMSTSADCGAVAGAWKKVDVVMSSDIKFYCDGVLTATTPNAFTFIANPEDQFRLGGTTAVGSTAPSNAFYGQLDELQVKTQVASAGWIQTEFNNQNSPGTFSSLGPVVGTPGTITTNYTWNWQNRMTAADTASGGVSFGYDSSGQRVQETRGSVRTWSPTTNYRITGTATPDITQTTKDIFLGSSIVGTIKGQGGAAIVSSVHADHLGSPSVLTSTTGAQSQLQAYSAYGTQVLQEGANLTDRDFTGHRFDADTSLTFANARYYNQDTGRFTSEDPAFWFIGDRAFESRYGQKLQVYLENPQSLNSYTYSNNNPISNADPTGEFNLRAYLEKKKAEAKQTVLEIGEGLNIMASQSKAVDFATTHPIATGLAVGVVAGGVAAGAAAAVTGLSATYAGGIGTACVALCGKLTEYQTAVNWAVSRYGVSAGALPTEQEISAVASKWATTNMTSSQTVIYHWLEHPGGTVAQLTQNAENVWNAYINNPTVVRAVTNVTLRNGDIGVKVRLTDGTGGIFTTGGQIVSSWFR
jgi:RHS repeat-associated protein